MFAEASSSFLNGLMLRIRFHQILNIRPFKKLELASANMGISHASHHAKG
jgi:hypothetical protein